jgi:hypothetical protein
MFQYALGRILAEEFGYRLVVGLHKSTQEGEHPYPEFKNWVGVDGEKHEKPTEMFRGQRIKLRPILRNREPRAIILNGFFQRSEYYIPHKEKIRSWFEIEPTFWPEPGDIAIHIRRDDFIKWESRIKLDFYTDLLKELNYDRLFIFGDIDEDVRKHFKEKNPIYATTESAAKDMRTMQCFDTFIRSNSTLSWWSAFLSNAKKIYCPVTKHGYGSIIKRINFVIKNDDRYVHLYDIDTE